MCKAERWFTAIPGMQPEFVEALITDGFFSYTDLTFLEAEQLGEMLGISPDDADEMIIFAEEAAERIEREGEPEIEQAEAEAAAAAAAEAATAEEAAVDAGADVGVEPVEGEAQETAKATQSAPDGGFESLFKHDAEAASPISPTVEESDGSVKTEADGETPAS